MQSKHTFCVQNFLINMLSKINTTYNTKIIWLLFETHYYEIQRW